LLSHPIQFLRRGIRRSAAPLVETLRDPRPAYQLIRQTARRQWKHLSLNLVFNLFQAFCEGATLGVIFLAVDLLSRNSAAAMEWQTKPILSQLPGFTAWLDQLSLVSLFVLLLLAAILLKLAQSISMYLASVNMAYYGARVNAQVTALIHSRILGLSFPCASRYPVGDLTYYASAGPGTVTKQIGIASGFIVNCMMFATYLTVLVVLSPWLLIAAAVMAGVLTLVQRELLPRIRRRGFKGTAISVAISTRIVEDIQGLRLLHSSGQLDQADQKMRDRMGELEENSIARGKLGAVVAPITTFMPILMIGLIAGMSLLVFGSRNTGILPSLATFVVALQRLNGTFGAIAGSFTQLNSNAAGLKRLDEILDPADKEFRRRDGSPFRGLTHSVSLENLSLRYAPDLPEALREINLDIPKGQTVALVGTSGAGKSSIADLLVGLYQPTSGKILIDGQDLQQINLPSWQQRLGVVSQDTFLFNASLAFNISFGTPGTTREQIEMAASKAQAHGFISAMPNGYDTLVGERGYRLSGGQRQRISLARAILRDPDLLILDEATSALDSNSERLVQQAIEQFERQHTVLVIAHRLSTIVNADLICVMEAGQIVERGNHQELLAHSGRYTDLWRQQVRNSEVLAGRMG
jgi:subfamily B ATP-binding cassette protein MsbA